MSKILCSISGIEFSCDHLPLYLDQREAYHPVFAAAQKKLYPLYNKYMNSELNSIDSYLVFLAFLKSTDLVEFRVPAQRTDRTDSIVANHFEHLVQVCSRINSVRNPSVKFAHIAITPENKTLDNIQYWLLNWDACYDDFKTGYQAQRARADLATLEEKLDYLAADCGTDDIRFATKLAEWADKAGSFPRFQVQVGTTVMTCAEYWKQIIRKCVNVDSIFGINYKDLEELTNHCYDNIEVGSIYSHNLFATLKAGAARQHNFLGMSGFSFSILPENSVVEEANKSVIISNAPTKLPNRLDYPSQFAYIKAKLAYEMAQAAETKAELEALQHSESTNLGGAQVAPTLEGEKEVELLTDSELLAINSDTVDTIGEGEFNV